MLGFGWIIQQYVDFGGLEECWVDFEEVVVVQVYMFESDLVYVVYGGSDIGGYYVVVGFVLL